MEYKFFDDMSTIKGVKAPKSQLGFKRMTEICNAAESLFDKNGFYETSIADICAKAGTAVGTFYIYFHDKTSIYNYLVRNYYVVIKHHLNSAVKDCQSRLDMECEGIKAFIKFGYDNPQCYKIIWGSMYIDPDIFENYYTRFAKSYTHALQKYSNEVIDVDYTNASYALMGIANFICLKTIFSKEVLTEEELDKITNDVRAMLTQGLFKV